MADAEQIYRDHPTDEEIADVLASQGTAAVGTVNADGSVHHRSTGQQLMVSLEGTGRIIDGDEARRINHDLRAKYIQPEALDEIDRAWNSFDDVAVELTADRVRSWTGTIMHAETQQHLSQPYESIWL
jgi:hypothetical protein